MLVRRHHPQYHLERLLLSGHFSLPIMRAGHVIHNMCRNYEKNTFIARQASPMSQITWPGEQLPKAALLVVM